MNCDDYLDYVSGLLKFSSFQGFESGSNRDDCKDDEWFRASVSNVTNSIVVPFIGFFGVLGNSLNLVVLTRKQLVRCSTIERSYNSGLVAMAAADLVICLLYSLKATMDFGSLKGPKESNLPAYFSAYAEPIINVAIFASTWFTTAVAVGRYIAICHPLRTRSFVNLRAVRVCVFAILLGAVLVNLPRFLRYRVVVSPCMELFSMFDVPTNIGLGSFATTVDSPFLNINNNSNSGHNNNESINANMLKEFRKLSEFYDRNRKLIEECPCFYSHKIFYFFEDPAFRSTYNITATIITILVPLLIMIFCNVCFVKALRQSFAMQRVFRSRGSCGGKQSSTTVVTTVSRVKDGTREERKEGECRFVGSGRYSSRRKVREMQDNFAKSTSVRLDGARANFIHREGQGHDKFNEEKIAEVQAGNSFDKKIFLAPDRSKAVRSSNNKHRREERLRRMQKLKPQRQSSDDHYITPTLVTLIVFFVILVTPSELLGIFQTHVIAGHDIPSSYSRLRTAVDITNCFHLLNFSVNVVLYSIINVKFRRTVKKIFCCICCCRAGSSHDSGRGGGSCCRRHTGNSDCESENTGINKIQMTSALDN